MAVLGLAGSFGLIPIDGGAAGVLDNQQVASVIGMNALVPRLTQNAIQSGDHGRPGSADLNDFAIAAGFLREEQGIGERIVGGAIDRVEMSQAVGPLGSEQSYAVGGIVHIEGCLRVVCMQTMGEFLRLYCYTVKFR